MLTEVLSYVFIFDPQNLGLTTTQLKAELKNKVRTLIEQYFVPIQTTSHDWQPFKDGDGEVCDILDFLGKITVTDLNINSPNSELHI